MSVFAVFDAVVGVAHSAIEGLAALLTPTVGGLAAAVAIVGFTILVRLLVSPLSWLQARAAKRGAALAPEVAKLREKHRDDPMALASETLALQRANGAGPGMSLLPALVQAPFFIVMYRLVQPGPGQPHGLLAGDLFGVPLTAHVMAGLPVFATLIGLAAALAIWTSRRARKSLAATTPLSTPNVADSQVAKSGSPRPAASRSSTKPAGRDRAPTTKAADPSRAPSTKAPGRNRTPSTKAADRNRALSTQAADRNRALSTPAAGRDRALTTKAAGRAGAAAKPGRAGSADDGGSAGQSAVEAAGPLVGRLMTFMPYLTVLMVAYLPLAGALYLVTSTAWTALEQAVWRRPVHSGNR